MARGRAFNLSSVLKRIDLDETGGARVDLEAEPWFPKVAASSVTDGDEELAGFESKTLHVRWDSIPMLLPSSDLMSSEWWNHENTWGEFPSLVPMEVSPSPIGWKVLFAEHEALVLPMDEDGHGRRLSELNHAGLHTAIGGLQHEGRDVILIYNRLDSEELPRDEKHLRMAGEALGRFHSQCGKALSTPNDERAWNKRLDILEPRTRSATKWRAPHSADTQGTITHRNFGLDNCRLKDGKLIITGCAGGIYNALVPLETPSPAIRDVAAAIIELSSDDRQSFCEGWASTAPAHWSSSKALDSHKGGLLIWEYEQMLEHRLFHQAWGREEPAHITAHLASISSLQSGMYQARTLAAAGLILLVIPPCAAFYWLFYPGAVTPSWNDVGGVAALAAIGIALRRMYRAAAPKPW